MTGTASDLATASVAILPTDAELAEQIHKALQQGGLALGGWDCKGWARRLRLLDFSWDRQVTADETCFSLPGVKLMKTPARYSPTIDDQVSLGLPIQAAPVSVSVITLSVTQAEHGGDATPEEVGDKNVGCHVYRTKFCFKLNS